MNITQMNIPWWEIFQTLCYIIILVLSIAAASIAMDCYDKNEQMKKEKSSNYNFAYVSLVVQVMLLLVAIVSIYYTVYPRCIY